MKPCILAIRRASGKVVHVTTGPARDPATISIREGTHLAIKRKKMASDQSPEDRSQVAGLRSRME